MSGTIGSERPFRDVLTELTFEANDEGLDPYDAYVRLREKMDAGGLRADDYCSSSITSGGHARDASLTMAEVIGRNTDTALAVGDELFRVGQLHPKRTIEAVALGKLAWKQSEYMTFWLAVMAGAPTQGADARSNLRQIRADFATALRTSDTVDMEVFDSKQPAEVRAPHYFGHAQLFASIARRYDPSPAHRLIRLIDPDKSLGAQTENVFATLMGTRVFKVALAQTGLEPPGLQEPPRIVADVEPLIRFGAAVFDTVRQEQLVLVPQSAE